jgi:phosphoserine phosphatase
MTQHYAELSTKEASFGELRNLMDLSVVAALVAKEQLLETANCQIPTIMSPDSPLSHVSLHSPKSIETLCSQVKRGNTVIVISGGVQIGSWAIADKVEMRPAVAQIRQKAKPTGSAGQAWWNPGR